MKQTLETVKSWFRTGSKPTQQQFSDTWDSFWHKDDELPGATTFEELTDVTKSDEFTPGDTNVLATTQATENLSVQLSQFVDMRYNDVSNMLSHSYSELSNRIEGLEQSSGEGADVVVGGKNLLVGGGETYYTNPYGSVNIFVEMEQGEGHWKIGDIYTLTFRARNNGAVPNSALDVSIDGIHMFTTPVLTENFVRYDMTFQLGTTNPTFGWTGDPYDSAYTEFTDIMVTLGNTGMDFKPAVSESSGGGATTFAELTDVTKTDDPWVSDSNVLPTTIITGGLTSTVDFLVQAENIMENRIRELEESSGGEGLTQEVGTWTPQTRGYLYNFFSGATARRGSYIKTGRHITYTFEIQLGLAVTSMAFPDPGVYITGMPFLGTPIVSPVLVFLTTHNVPQTEKNVIQTLEMGFGMYDNSPAMYLYNTAPEGRKSFITAGDMVTISASIMYLQTV